MEPVVSILGTLGRTPGKLGIHDRDSQTFAPISFSFSFCLLYVFISVVVSTLFLFSFFCFCVMCPRCLSTVLRCKTTRHFQQHLGIHMLSKHSDVRSHALAIAPPLQESIQSPAKASTFQCPLYYPTPAIQVVLSVHTGRLKQFSPLGIISSTRSFFATRSSLTTLPLTPAR